MSNEKDPKGLNPKAPGAKLDFGKAPVARGAIKYFPRALIAVAMLSLYGSEKYSWAGWAKVDDGINRYDDAIARHMVGEAIEGELDEAWLNVGKEVRHATAVAWNALARLELILQEEENGKRTGKQNDRGNPQATESFRVEGKDAQSLPGRDSGRVVLGTEDRPVDRVQVVTKNAEEEGCPCPICTSDRLASREKKGRSER